MTLLRASISLHARVATARRGFPRAFTITPLAPHTSLSSFSSFSSSSFSSSICSLPSPSPYKVFLSEYSTKAIVNALPHDLASNNVDEKEKTKLESTETTETTETTLPPNTITPTTATITGTTTATAATTTTTTSFVGPAGDAGFCSTSNVPIADRTMGITNARDLLDAYMSLSKVRLSSLVIVTTMAGYVLAPAPFHVDAFLLSSIGTALAIGSANTFNQIYEVANDAQMARTRQRILPTGRISMRHAYLFGSATGIIGPAILLYTINPLAAALAFSNIALYAGIYTPLKRIHPINTWVGGIVGAIPPAIGWVAATNSLDMGAWVLGGLLFIWQIPHFLALSWSLKKDYGNAGYKMLSTVNPEILPKLCLRYCIYMFPIGPLCWWAGITDGYFAFDSMLVNAYFTWFAYQFYRDNSTVKSRKLFFASVIFLPVFLLLMGVHAKKFRSQDSVEAIESSSLNKT